MKKIFTASLLMLACCISFSQFVNLPAQAGAQTSIADQFPRSPSGMIRCGTPAPDPKWDEWFNAQVEEFKKGIASGKIMLTNYTIPVVVHIVHGGQAEGTYPNLSQTQINSQITVLNQDYSGTGYATNTYPDSAYKHWAKAQNLPAGNLDANGRVAIANTGIQFCAATQDPSGNVLAEPGIDRVNYVTQGWSDPASFSSISAFQNFINDTVKPATIWDATQYLNMWVTDEYPGPNPGLLGYATFPAGTTLIGIPGGTGTATTDGFWAYAQAFGSKNIYPSGTYLSPYDMGRTCSHELGHYLGLRHTWGDGNCATDYCNDTPTETAANFNCPSSYPFNSGTCSSPSNSPDGEMTMNFMDYSNDNCMYMFTVDQTARIQTAMQTGTFRTQLSTSASTICVLGVNDIITSQAISVYPNPSKGNIEVKSDKLEISAIEIYNVLGEKIYKTPSLKGVKQINISLPSGLGQGIYLLKAQTPNGMIMKKIILER